MTIRDSNLIPGSAGCQPVAFGSLAECISVGANNDGSEKTVRGKVPQTAGWQPALPGIRLLSRIVMVDLARRGRVPE